MCMQAPPCHAPYSYGNRAKWCWGTVTTRPHAKKRLVHVRVTHYYKKSKRPFAVCTEGAQHGRDRAHWTP